MATKLMYQENKIVMVPECDYVPIENYKALKYLEWEAKELFTIDACILEGPTAVDIMVFLALLSQEIEEKD